MIVMMMIMHLLMIVIEIISSSCQVFNFFMLYLMMIHLSDIHIIIHVGIFYVVVISFTLCHGRC